jgi:hypothetical protein
MTLPQRHYTLAAAVTLANAATGWEVAAISPPDPDEVLAPDSPDNIPAALPATTTAAHVFITSWLAYTYGHATARQLRDLTTQLQVSLAANPPQIEAVAQRRKEVTVPVTVGRDVGKVACLGLLSHLEDGLEDLFKVLSRQPIDAPGFGGVYATASISGVHPKPRGLATASA